MTRASEVAKIFKSWAVENRLMGEVLPSEIISDDDKDELYDSLRITAANEQALRIKAISAVGFNDAANEVLVFTRLKLTTAQLKTLPTEYNEEIKIKYLHGGVASASVPNSGVTKEPYNIFNEKYTCGSSIHPVRAIGAGTLGALVIAPDGEIFGLSNNHVSGMSNYAQIGEKILAPGHIDVEANGINPFTIGHHKIALNLGFGSPDNVDIDNNNDAALIQLTDSNWLSSMQGQAYDTPADCIDLLAGYLVQKVGRTTGHTSGTVIAQIVGASPVGYNVHGQGNHVAYFNDVFVVEGIGEPFSLSGDSGSLVTTTLNNVKYGVGLIFAGDGTHSYILPLKPILNAFNVRLHNNHHV
ncbi:hypothetical protein [Undibacterium sp. Tian12W]|uniref:hypothetical protein n=1 Tax=Undibacterium sp. Tian12W TaxID=3413054 RepID=UPI003BEFFAE1